MIHVRQMTAADLLLGMRLKQQAGWNQLEADWRRMLALQPDGCFVAEVDGVGVGTTVACSFGDVAWIAMVLVAATVRGQGIGKALMQHALEFLDRRGTRTIRLDATPLGQPLYAKLGFEVEYTLIRYAGVVQALPAAPGSDLVQTARREHWPALLALDAQVNHTNRAKFLTQLFAENPEAVRYVKRGQEVAGYLTVRPGCNALQLGPCLADSTAGPLLLADAGRRHAGQHVFWDVPEQHRGAVQLAAALGLQAQRPLVRMCRGASVQEDFQRLWASSGPELG